MENGYFLVGNTLSPATSSLTNTVLYDIDPVLYRIIQYFSGVLTLHMTPRWNAVVTQIGRTDLVNKVVNQSLPYDPLPFATENQFRFPLLCAYRTHEDYEWKTASWYHIISNIEILYILPPLTSDQGENLYPFLSYATKVMVDRLTEGFDSNFNAGEQVWSEAGLEQIGMTSCDFGKIPKLDSNIFFPTVSVKCECVERRMPVEANFENYMGMDGYVSSDGYVDNLYTTIDMALVRT